MEARLGNYVPTIVYNDMKKILNDDWNRGEIYNLNTNEATSSIKNHEVIDIKKLKLVKIYYTLTQEIKLII